jgi:serine phosphatase RsbU (regulator of sigma subunit)/pSer/pThr/pTyr-binding forkhead associated (FHA) protein
VSREHARLVLRDGRPTVVDLESRNGTWVNGNRIAGQTTLRSGDRVEIGGVVFDVLSDDATQRTIFAADDDMSTSAALPWRELYGPAPTGGQAAADRTLTLFQVLAEAGELLADQRPLVELFEVILDLVDKIVSSDRTVLLLVEDAQPELVLTAWRNRRGGADAHIMLSRTMVDRVVRERTSLVTADAKQDPRFEKQESIILQGTRSAMAAPLFDNASVVGVLYADTTDPALRYTTDELRAFTILANLIGVKITQARTSEAREANRRHEQELQMAKSILARILPEALVTLDGYELAECQDPCLTVGGDLYDAIALSDGRVAIVMGDVTGKGLGAAMLVSNIMASLRLLTDDRVQPVELVARLNRHVYRFTDPVHYATLFFGVLDPTTGIVEYVNAGHNPPLLGSQDGGITEIEATGIPVGMFDEVSYTAGRAQLEPGGFLLLYSDGIPEAESASDEEFGMEKLVDVLRNARHLPAPSIVDAIQGAVRDFLAGSPATDDVTMLLIRRLAT